MAAGGLIFGAVFFLGLGWITMTLWNLVVPDISSLPAVTFWQAVGIFVLARLLVGRFGHGGRRHRHGRWHHYRTPAQEPNDYEDWWSREGEEIFRDYLRRRGAAGDESLHAG